MDGIIVFNKPAGRTSHDMVSFIRRLAGVKKVGHTGTLDPEATGVLPICIGKATKAADMLTLSDKCYRAQLVLGMITDTQDAEGEVIAECGVSVSEDDIIEAVSKFKGIIRQIPPMYSAIKIGGKKLYELARAGREIERPKRQVNIYSIDILCVNLDEGIVDIEVECSKGTYIRTLCEDIGIALGCGAYMNRLERTRSGMFSIGDSYTQEELVQMKEAGTLDNAVISIEKIFCNLPEIRLDERQTKKVLNGVKIRIIAEDGRYRIYDEKGEFICISKAENGILILEKSFWK